MSNNYVCMKSNDFLFFILGMNDNGTIVVKNDQVRLNENIQRQIRFVQMKNTIF